MSYHTTFQNKAKNSMYMKLKILIYISTFFLKKGLNLPFDVGNVKDYHYKEWMLVYESFIKQKNYSSAFYFAITRPLDVIAINHNFKVRSKSSRIFEGICPLWSYCFAFNEIVFNDFFRFKKKEGSEMRNCIFKA